MGEHAVCVQLDIRPQLRTTAGSKQFLISFTDISELKRTQQQLRQELSEKETLLKEIHHRVKNNLNVIASLLALQSDTIETAEEAKKALSNSRNRAYYMAQVHEQLYRSHSLSYIDMSAYLRTVTADLAGIYDAEAKRISVEVEAGSVEMSVSAAIPLGLLVNELVTNALAHAFPEEQNVGKETAFQHWGGETAFSEEPQVGGKTVFPEGRITVSLKEVSPEEYQITVTDDGVGLPEDFTPEGTESLGWRLITALSEQLNGELQVSGTEGTSVSIRFPKPG
jgi:two-component sensor histidine kinase